MFPSHSSAEATAGWGGGVWGLYRGRDPVPAHLQVRHRLQRLGHQVTTPLSFIFYLFEYIFSVVRVWVMAGLTCANWFLNEQHVCCPTQPLSTPRAPISHRLPSTGWNADLIHLAALSLVGEASSGKTRMHSFEFCIRFPQVAFTINFHWVFRVSPKDCR